MVQRDRDKVESQLQVLDGVERTFASSRPFRLASREFHPENSIVHVSGVPVGGERLIIMAGPCAVESYEQLQVVGKVLTELNVPMIRGGAFKPRSSPYSFQGLGEQGLELLQEVRNRTGLKVVTECLKPQDVELVGSYADLIQVGARNMQNFALLQELGRCRVPVLLKRGMMNSLEEFLMSAEYILANGNHQVILCERGIRTFETMTRNTLDISAVPVLRRLTHLPIIIDPSHAAGDRELVPALSLAGIAAGADGLIIEIHPDPDKAWSDGPQCLNFEGFGKLMQQIAAVAQAVGRTV
jgi:3-deoxy-7-phosphoheptulonate synthase